MALTDKQKRILINFLLEKNGDIEWLYNWSLKSPAQRKTEVTNWWNARKAKLEADKATINEDLLEELKAPLDEEITDGDGLVTNL